MDKYAVKRLEQLENYIRLDTIRIKYLRNYIDDINNKINELFNSLKNKDLTFDQKEQIRQELNLHTCHRNKMYNDIDELESLLQSVEEEKQNIIDKDGNCVFKID